MRGPMQPFYLGISLAGTVSAEAYSAGVMDFLIEAMDAWSSQRAKEKEQHGDNYSAWSIPPHELQLAVLSGASGGGMVGATAAAVLSQEFHAVHEQSPAPAAGGNALFRSWVEEIHPKELLGHADLDKAAHPPSLIDCSPIRSIAERAIRVDAPLSSRREWVRDGLRVLFTLTNLRGVPYAVEPQTQADSARTLDYADRRLFEILWTAPPSGGEALPLNARGGTEWQSLAETAVATGAFPLVVAAQQLNRIAREYNVRQTSVPPERGEPGKEIPFKPVWDLADDAPFETLNVDGGVTNNSPFDAARLQLAKLPPANPGGHNVRDPLLADRAVIGVAPLSGRVAATPPRFPDEHLGSIAAKIIEALVNQSRIQGENLTLSSDPRVASRWVIEPTSSDPEGEPLAGALLGGFAGFFSPLFRAYDYQMGRRNCQRFLTRYFGVPWANPIMRQYGVSPEAQSRLDQEYGFDAEYSADGQAPARLFPLIPVLPALRGEIMVEPIGIDRPEVAAIVAMAMDRAKRVAKALLKDGGAGPLSGLAFRTAWPLFRSKFEGMLVNYVADELDRHGFLRRPHDDIADLIEEIRKLRREIGSVKNTLT